MLLSTNTNIYILYTPAEKPFGELFAEFENATSKTKQRLLEKYSYTAHKDKSRIGRVYALLMHQNGDIYDVLYAWHIENSQELERLAKRVIQLDKYQGSKLGCKYRIKAYLRNTFQPRIRKD